MDSANQNSSRKTGFGNKLFADDTHKDFKIFVENENEKQAIFGAHKCILAVQSPVLAALVTSKMLEGHSSQMKIIDFDSKTVEESLEFMYKGEITLESSKNPMILSDLLNFAHKYDVQELVDYCIEQIDKNKVNIDKNSRRTLIKNAVKLDCEKILDSILGVFGTGKFVKESLGEENKGQLCLVPPIVSPLMRRYIAVRDYADDDEESIDDERPESRGETPEDHGW